MLADELFQSALFNHRSGRNTDAETFLRRVIEADANHCDAHTLLGIIALQGNRPAAAVESLSKSASLRPSAPEIQNNLGNALRALGRFDEAHAALAKAVQLRPDYVLAHNNLGTVLRAMGRYPEATAAYRAALRLKPDFFEAVANLGNVLKDQGELREAADAFRRAIKLRPNSADAHCGLGNVLAATGDFDTATVCYRTALQVNANHPAAMVNLAVALKRQNKIDPAIELLQRAVALHPQSADAHETLASSLWDAARVDEALRHYQLAIEFAPSARLRIALATLIPPIYSSSDEVGRWRERLSHELAALRAENVRQDLSHQLPKTAFYLPYQGLDDRAVQQEIAGLYTVSDSIAAVTPAGKTIRVGFISGQFKDQTVGLWMQGIVAELDRSVFEVTVLSAGVHRDATNRSFRTNADRYVELPSSLPAARKAVVDCGLHVLVYADLGMEPFTFALAFSRLAPVQCVMWGHPLTSGLPAVDYYISSALAEVPEAAAHYTEKLVCLPNLPLYYYRPAPPTAVRDRAFFGLPAVGNVYGCLQSLFKLHPDFDFAMAEILRRDSSGIIVLPEGNLPGWDAVLKARFAKTMPDVSSRIHFVRRMDRDEFRSLSALCQVMLAPFPFGAGDTSLEAFALGIAVVTLPTPFLKGRFTLAMYRAMKIDDCIAKDASGYVEIAVRLGMDASTRARVGERIRSANQVLYENAAGVRDLEKFLRDIALNPSLRSTSDAGF